MSSADERTPTPGPKTTTRRSFGRWLSDQPRWEKIALGVASVAVVGGGVWTLVAGDVAPTPEVAGGGVGDAGSSALGAGLVPNQPSGGTGNETGQVAAAEGEPASKGIFRLGFSFIAGFCVGIFVRSVLKLAAIAVGFWIVMTSLLSYADLVVVDWQAINDLWPRFMSTVESEWGNFQTFMLGSLPATGLAVTGLAVGFKRR